MNLIINSLANFRITLFREYPYLYDGRMEDEQAHLTHYTNSPNSIILTHTINNEVIGIATGLPLCEEDPAVQAPFLNTPAPYTLDKIFYIGEVMVLPDHQGKGLGPRLISEMLDQIRAKDYKLVCFYTVDRGQNHPAKPANYKSPDRIWERAGFTKDPSRIAYFSWKDIGDNIHSTKPMNVWTKVI